MMKSFLPSSRIGLFTVLLCAASLLPLSTQAGGKSGNYGSWTVGCQKDKAGQSRCTMSQIQAQKGAKTPVMVTNIFTPPGANSPIMLFILPLGVYLPQGVSFAVDDKEVARFSYQRCEPSGCGAITPLDDKLLARITAGTSAKVTFLGASGKPVNVTLSLKGFPQALEQLGTLKPDTQATAP